MAYPVTSLSSNGVYFTDRYFDEVTVSSNKITPSTVFSSHFDEVSLVGSPMKRETSDGQVLVSGYFDEVTGITVPYGATLPWVSYDVSNYSSIYNVQGIRRNSNGSSYNIYDVSAESKSLSCVNLSGTNTSIKWIATTPANFLTIRYGVSSVPSGTITLGITGSNIQNIKVPVTSNQSWLYINKSGTEYTVPTPNTIPCKRYNETRVVLPSAINTSDVFEVRIDSGDTPVYFDVLETELATTITNPNTATYLNIKDSPFNAYGNGINDDTTALKSCIATASSLGKNVYLPTGTYNLSSSIAIPSNIAIQGAGMWYTNLVFTLTGNYSSGGINGSGSNITLTDLYIKGSQYYRDGYYAGIKGYWGDSSTIKNVWVEQTDIGALIGDYNNNSNITTNLTISSCRFRNTFADGVNLAQGTSSSTVTNCHVRGTGDDGLACWSSGVSYGKPMAQNNTFSNNTVENVWRASGLAIYGGQGHTINNNLVRNQVAGTGLRLNTIFVYINSVRVGHGFGSNPINIYNNTFQNILTGDYTSNLLEGAIELQTCYASVSSIAFNNNYISYTPYCGMRFRNVTLSPISYNSFSNITINKMYESNVLTGTIIMPSASGTASFDYPTIQYGLTNNSTSFTVNNI